MQCKRLWLGVCAALLPVTAYLVGAQAQSPAAPPVALTGQVASDAEGALEGVVVSAKKAGSTVTVSVVSDAQGRYSFPANRLSAGKYSLKIRAIGYDLLGQATADVTDEQTATVDLKLRKARNLAAQMSNAEWMMSLPGPEDEQAFLRNCVGGHTLERIVRSTHDADEWTQVIVRMNGYGPVSQPIKPQRMLDPARSGSPEQFRKQAEYLASVNLGEVTQWEYPLKTLPRPTGRATRVIVTEYDLPRPTTEPHDVLVDAQGAVWYSDFGELFISKFDPKTLKLTEYPLKKFKEKAPVGNLSLEFDKGGTLWFDTMYQGSLGNLDHKTGEINCYRLATRNARARRMVIDDQERILLTEYRGNKLALSDTKTEKVKEWQLPPFTYPYRAAVDKNGELWTGGMHTDRSVRLDPNTGAAVE